MRIDLTLQNLLIISPIIIIQLSLALFCIIKIFKEGVANLNKWIWVLIVLFISLFGPVIFLTVGRRRDY